MPDPDLVYQPDGRLGAFVQHLDAVRTLFIGDPDSYPEGGAMGLLDTGAEVRFFSMAQARLAGAIPAGLYGIRHGGLWYVVVNPDGRAPEPARSDSSSYLADDFDPLLIAKDFVLDWEGASHLTPEDVLSPGTYFRRAGTNDYGMVVSHRRVDGDVQYTVDVRGERLTLGGREVEPVSGHPSDPMMWLDAPPAGPDEMRLTLAWNKLRHPLTDVLYSYRASRTLFRPYQFKPILKMMNGFSHRLLIADEVGLGKTIEAGLVWSELQGRAPLQRVLVVCPSSLTLKWQTEMRRRFDRRLEVVDAVAWQRLFSEMEDGHQASFFGVVSMERLRSSEEVLERLASLGIRFDLVIVDEAHRMRNPGNLTHAMGEILATSADALILLTATPVNLGNRDLFTLLNFLDPAQFTSPELFEAQARPNAIVNEAASLLLKNQDAGLVREKLEELRGDPLGRVLIQRPDVQELMEALDGNRALTPAQMHAAKRTMAGMGPFSNYISRTRKRDVPDAKAIRCPVTLSVEWTAEEVEFYNAVRRWTRDRALREGHPPGFVEQMPLRQTASCIPAMVRRLRQSSADSLDDDYLAQADYVADQGEVVAQLDVRVPVRDTKFEKLLEALTQVRRAGFRQVMIFSYFRFTLDYLSDQLSSRGFKVRVMHGGVDPRDRDTIQSDFRAGAFEVLLLSEVGSEGLDFEFCGALVNYDLPWNPMRVEQRIGRLDRFGQKHERIHIYNFSVSGTVEDQILLRLFDRIKVFESSIGELEPILADVIDDLEEILVSPFMTESERSQRALEIEVALAAKEELLRQLKEQEGSLTSLDNLLIDGFEADNPGRGRYVSSSEIFAIVADLCRRTKADVSRNGEDKLTIKPSVQLAEEVGKQNHADKAVPIHDLPARLRGREPVKAGFNPETMAEHEVLLTVRHPLVRAGLRLIEKDPSALKRFGHVSLVERPERQALAAVSLLEFSGVRQSLELTASVVDSRGRALTELADLLFAGLTSDTVLPGVLPLPADLHRLFAAVDDLADHERISRQRDREIHDGAFIEARRASVEHSYEIQSSQVRERLWGASNPRIVRMLEGQLRNLRLRKDETLDGLSGLPTSTTRKLLCVVAVDY